MLFRGVLVARHGCYVFGWQLGGRAGGLDWVGYMVFGQL